MAIRDTSLQSEIDRILELGPVDAHYLWVCEIHTPVDTFEVYRLLSIDIDRDYVDAYSDNVRIEVAIPNGQYTHRILPYRNNITVTLQKRPIGELTEEEDMEASVSRFRMRAVLDEESNPLAEGNLEYSTKEETADHMGIVEVSFQLLDLAIEQLRLKTTGTIVRDAVPGEALQALLSRMSKSIKVPEDAAVKGVDLVEPDNQNIRQHVVIPQGTKVINLPGYIQRYAGGIYNKGMGYYLQQGIWYLYPQFALDRFDKTGRTLTVITLPTNRYPTLDRTYRSEGGKVIVLSTAKVTFHDDSEVLQLNQGNGVRYVDSSRVLESTVEVSKNKALIRKEDRAAEYLLQERADGQNTAFFSEERITDNHAYQASLLARRAGTHVEVNWENSNPDLIYPGMPVRYHYYEEDVVRTLNGIVIRAYSYIASAGQGIGSRRHRSITNLVLFLEKPELLSEQ